MRIAMAARHPPCTSPATHSGVLNTQNSINPSTTRSTAVRIGRRWAEYQGANNWDGLLNPLDATLRSEILRYGEFINATYTAFDFDPSSPSYAACRYPKHSLLPRSGLPGTGYRVTRNLHATSGAALPRWAGLPLQSSWIGYVAVCHDEAEIARLGRRDIVIALRGTATGLEWADNLCATLTHLPDAAASDNSAPMVEHGFWSLFASSGSARRSLRNEIRDEIARLVASYCGSDSKPLSLTVAGHSLGAALAVLTAYDVTTMLGREAPMVTVVSFGGPRVGNASFRRRLEERGSKVLRIVNTEDVVTKVPGFLEDDVGGEGVVPGPSWLSRTGWVYADIGSELQVSSRGRGNVATCHDLRVYLNLVKELSTKCLRSKVKERLRRPLAVEAHGGERIPLSDIFCSPP